LPDLSNRWVFASNRGSDVILQFRFDQTSGQLTPSEPSSVGTKRGAGPCHLALYPNRRWVFCINEGDATLDSYQLDEAGTLTRLDSRSVMPPDSQDGSKNVFWKSHLDEDSESEEV
jgi:6-phosphogluconolactonase